MEVAQLADYPDQAHKIAHWYYNEWACHAPNVSESMVLKNVIENANNRDSLPLSIIVRKNNQMVGVAELKYRENKNFPDYVHWLGGVFVDPAYRSCGIANLLIADVQGKALSLGINRLYLQCETHNVALYKKQGFQALHLANNNDKSVVIMSWEATDPK